jgi:hypothetical protein
MNAKPTRTNIARAAALATAAACLTGIGIGSPTAVAESLATQRTMACVGAEESVSFTGEQVRNGATPHVWRNVDVSASPSTFVFHGLRMISPDGTVEILEATVPATERTDTFECSFVIPVGPNIGKTAVFTGFFTPDAGDRSDPEPQP